MSPPWPSRRSSKRPPSPSPKGAADPHHRIIQGTESVELPAGLRDDEWLLADAVHGSGHATGSTHLRAQAVPNQPYDYAGHRLRYPRSSLHRGGRYRPENRTPTVPDSGIRHHGDRRHVPLLRARGHRPPEPLCSDRSRNDSYGTDNVGVGP